MKETKNIWRTGKTAALLLLAVLLACAVIVPASAEDSSAVFTPQEIQGMMTAGSVFSDVFDDALYNSLDDSAKADYMATVLGSLSGPSGSAAVMMNSVPGLPSANGNQQAQVQYQTRTNSILQQHDLSAYSAPLINRESIYYNADTKTFSFVYNTGVLAMVSISKDTCCDELGEDALLTDMQDNFIWGEQEDKILLPRAISGDKALLVYDLDRTGYRISTLHDIKGFLLGNNPQIISTIKQNPTVSEYKSLLSGDKYITILSHGNVFQRTPFSNKYPCITLTEQVTDSTITQYDADLQNQRIVLYYDDPAGPTHISDTFAILPKFFEYYYSSNGLNDAYVHLGICKGFGEINGENYALASKLTSSGASVVTGYYKSVFIPYDHGMIKSITRNLVDGKSLQAAVDIAKGVQGNTGPDGEYLVVYGNGGWTL